MQCLVHSRHFVTHRYRKNWLFGAREVRVVLSQHLSFFLTLFPVTGCWSWLGCLQDCSSHFNSDNSSSGKPFQTLPRHKTAAISFTCCIWYPLHACAQDLFLGKSLWWLLLGTKGSTQCPEHQSLGWASARHCSSHLRTGARKAWPSIFLDGVKTTALFFLFVF